MEVSLSCVISLVVFLLCWSRSEPYMGRVPVGKSVYCCFVHPDKRKLSFEYSNKLYNV